MDYNLKNNAHPSNARNQKGNFAKSRQPAWLAAIGAY